MRESGPFDSMPLWYALLRGLTVSPIECALDAWHERVWEPLARSWRRIFFVAWMLLGLACLGIGVSHGVTPTLEEAACTAPSTCQ